MPLPLWSPDARPENACHEKFAQTLASGKTADASYKIAGFKPNRQNAARLTTNDDICARASQNSRKSRLTRFTTSPLLLWFGPNPIATHPMQFVMMFGCALVVLACAC